MQDIAVYPNPCSDFFNINLNQLASEINIDIFNSNGDKVISQIYLNSNNIHISVENLKRGFYFVKMKIDDKIFTERIVIQ